MKRIILTIAFLTFTLTALHAQSMGSFFKHNGVAIFANLAHPTNIYKSGRYTIYSNHIIVEINYECCYTKLKIKRSGDVFYDIDVLSDNDWVAPFVGVELMKDLVIEAANEDSESKEQLSAFEKKFQKSLYEMTGIELTCILLTLSWLDY